MTNTAIALPEKPKVVKEEEFSGIYEIDGLQPGYGHTLGNSLRRIILSSLEGAAITSVKIDEASHEFTTLDHVKEDVITILLNLKRIRFKMITDEPQIVTIDVSGEKDVTSADIVAPGQVEVIGDNQHIASLTNKKASFKAEIKIEKGVGFVDKEELDNGRVEINHMIVDALFSPIRRVNYEVENMRVGDNTKFNRLRISIETDGSITPREALESSIRIMIDQLCAIVDISSEQVIADSNVTDISEIESLMEEISAAPVKEVDLDALKTRVDDEELGLSNRTATALSDASIRTLGGLVRKTESDLLDLPGLGEKGLSEIKEALVKHNATLASE